MNHQHVLQGLGTILDGAMPETESEPMSSDGGENGNIGCA